MKTNPLLTAAGVAIVLCMVACNASAQGAPGGGGGGGLGGGPGGGGRGGLGGAPAGSQASVGVTAVADDRANSLVVNASAETMKQIEDMVKELDQAVAEDLIVKVYRLTNADPSEVSYQISSLFYNPATSTPQAGGFGQQGGLGGSSDRQKRTATVSTLPDPRTGALIVAASKSLFPQVEALILKLDRDPGYREQISFYELQNADVQDVYSSLQDLFNRSTARMQSSANSSVWLGQSSPLVQRVTASANQTSSAFGSSSTSSGATGATPTGF
jgi:type II secretory pathway component GspD/PulD (secretin)